MTAAASRRISFSGPGSRGVCAGQEHPGTRAAYCATGAGCHPKVMSRLLGPREGRTQPLARVDRNARSGCRSVSGREPEARESERRPARRRDEQPNVLVANFATPSPKFGSGARFAWSVPTEVAIDSAKPLGVDLVAVPTEVVEPVKLTVRRLPRACRRHRSGDDVRKTRSRKTRRHLPWGSVPSGEMSPGDRSVPVCLADTIRPQGFSPSRRFDPTWTAWLCFAPHPPVGFQPSELFPLSQP